MSNADLKRAATGFRMSKVSFLDPNPDLTVAYATITFNGATRMVVANARRNPDDHPSAGVGHLVALANLTEKINKIVQEAANKAVKRNAKPRPIQVINVTEVVDVDDDAAFKINTLPGHTIDWREVAVQ